MFCSSPPSVDALEVTAVEGLKRDSKFEPSPFKKRGREERDIERECVQYSTYSQTCETVFELPCGGGAGTKNFD